MASEHIDPKRHFDFASPSSHHIPHTIGLIGGTHRRREARACEGRKDTVLTRSTNARRGRG